MIPCYENKLSNNISPKTEKYAIMLGNLARKLAPVLSYEVNKTINSFN